jgi:hypothetical protein
MKKEIVIDVSDDGEVRIETKGFVGKACIEESQFIKDVLGHETAQKLSPAYYCTEKTKKKKYLQLCG